MTSWPSMQEMTLTGPPQRRQVAMSMLHTRLRRCAQVMAAWSENPAALATRSLDLSSTLMPACTRPGDGPSGKQHSSKQPGCHHHHEGDGNGYQHCDHTHVAIGLPVRQLGDGEHRHHGAAVRQ